MKKIVRGLQAIRNNWKKSAFAATVITLGTNYGKNAYDTRQLMRRYCEEAAKYGDEPQPLTKPLRRITVIINPAAKKRKCKDLYEKYCAPLLHLAGVTVTVVQTEFAGQAKDLPESLDPLTDAIVIAGGDGTLSETVTGLLRRAEGNLKALHNLPIAILPLGLTNELSSALYGNEDEVRSLADATMAVIDGSLRQIDVIKIEPIEEEGRPVYSLGRVEWGAHRDVHARRDKFWMFGPWRDYVAYLFAGVPKSAEWVCQYCEPCRGCSRCYVPDTSAKRWWHGFLPRTPPAAHLLVPNETCNVQVEKSIAPVCLSVATDTVAGDVQHPLASSPDQVSLARAPQLSLQVGPSDLGMFGLASEGWAKLNGWQPEANEVVPVRYLRLLPTKQGADQWFSIDNEDYEVKPIALTLLPKTVTVFVPRRDRRL